MKEKCCYLNSFDAMSLGFTEIAGFHFWSGFQRKGDGSYYTDLWKEIFRAQAHMNGEDVINTLSQNWGAWHHGKHRKTLKKKEYKNIYNLKGKKWREFKDNYLEDYNNLNYSIEMQCYVSDDKNQIVGYVKNRTYNVSTKSTGGDCDSISFKDQFPIDTLLNHRWDYNYYDGPLKITGLAANKTYKIAFYGNINGAIDYISFDSKLSSTSGKLKIRYPELRVEESWQNRPVVWFVAKREGYNGMIQNNDFTEHSSKSLSTNARFNIEGDTLTQNIPLNIYPNPFEEYFTIKSPIKDRILIQEPSGKVVKQQEISKGDNQIRTENLTTGFYFIHFINQNKIFKLIKL